MNQNVELSLAFSYFILCCSYYNLLTLFVQRILSLCEKNNCFAKFWSSFGQKNSWKWFNILATIKRCSFVVHRKILIFANTQNGFWPSGHIIRSWYSQSTQLQLLINQPQIVNNLDWWSNNLALKFYLIVNQPKVHLFLTVIPNFGNQWLSTPWAIEPELVGQSCYPSLKI